MNDLQTSWKGGVGCKQYTRILHTSQKKYTARPLRGPDLKNCLQFVFSPWCAHGHDALYIGGPGTLSHFPQCLLPPIMCCRFYVYEGSALIARMCMRCKEAQEFCRMPPPTEHAIAHRAYFHGNRDSAQENKHAERKHAFRFNTTARVDESLVGFATVHSMRCPAAIHAHAMIPESKKQMTMTTQPSAQRPIVLKRES